MLLTIDIGNSNIVFALWDGMSWSKQVRLESKEILPMIYYEKSILNMLWEWGLTHNDIKECAISSVVPNLNERIEKSIENTLGIKPFIITPQVLLHLDLCVPHPYEIGSDLVSNAYAGSTIYSKNCLIVDFGTALTFTIVTESEGITGVTIMPGLKTAIAALYLNTAQLPEVPIELPDSAIGHDTVSAIQSGVMWGYVGAVKEIIHKIKVQKNIDLKVIATGGLSKILQPLESEFDYINKNLTLEGIKLIYQYNQST